jgi:hypothetical protein
MPESHVRAQGSTRDAIKEFFAAEQRNAEKIEKFHRGLPDDAEVPPYLYQEFPKALYALDGDTCVVRSAAEEREKVADGWYATLAEQLAARESLEADLSQPEESEESADAAPPVKRSHKKKVA